jgi:hypothetical protein
MGAIAVTVLIMDWQKLLEGLNGRQQNKFCS